MGKIPKEIKDCLGRAGKEHIARLLNKTSRVEVKDCIIVKNPSKKSVWSNMQFIRLVAIEKEFNYVDFSNTSFDRCYIRNCKFFNCNFTGSTFVSSNFTRSKFLGCNFEYANFENSEIDKNILIDSYPLFSNLRMKFARNLRTNFQQIGDVDAVNLAINTELEATEIYLKKAWASSENYFRTKYAGFNRVKMFFAWLKFMFLHYLWGNGESILAFLWSFAFIIFITAMIDLLGREVIFSISEVIQSFIYAPQILFGVIRPDDYIGSLTLTFITITRFVMFGLFMALIIKRFNRR